MKYTFVTTGVVSLVTEVEADTLEEAIDQARARGVQSLCHQCCGKNADEEWATELDCEPGELVELWCGDEHKGETTEEFGSAKEAFE